MRASILALLLLAATLPGCIDERWTLDGRFPEDSWAVFWCCPGERSDAPIALLEATGETGSSFLWAFHTVEAREEVRWRVTVTGSAGEYSLAEFPTGQEHFRNEGGGIGRNETYDVVLGPGKHRLRFMAFPYWDGATGTPLDLRTEWTRVS